MANDTDKNTPNTGKPDLSTTSPTGTPTAKASGATAGSTGSTNPGPANTGSTNTGAPRPVTSRPAYGDPTVDRLSLEPADSDDWVTRTKMWAEENPALAIIGAVGIGLLVGRIVTAALPDPEPKTFTGKIERRAKLMAKEGRHYADDTGDAIAAQLAVAAEALSDAADAVSKNAKHGYSEAKDFSESIAEAIGDAFSKRASDWLGKLS